MSRRKSFDYATRLNCIWSWLFVLYDIGISYSRSITSKQTRKGVVFFVIFIQSTIFIHYSSAIILSSIIGRGIQTAAFLIPLTINALLAIVCLVTLYQRSHHLCRLLNHLTKVIYLRSDWAVSTWRHAIINLLLSNVILFIACVVVTVALLTADQQAGQFYTELYLAGAQLKPENVYLGLVIISVEFTFLFLSSMVLINNTISFYAHICHLLALSFKKFNEELELYLNKGKLMTSSQLNYFRHQHQRICQYADILSKLFSPCLVLCILGFITSVCFDLRTLKSRPPILLFTSFTVGAFRHFVLLLQIFFDAAQVNKKAHEIAERIVTMYIPETKFESHQQNRLYILNYILFSQRLLNSQIGVTASGLFLLNTTSFLSMTGTVLTYVIVLYQTA